MFNFRQRPPRYHKQVSLAAWSVITHAYKRFAAWHFYNYGPGKDRKTFVSNPNWRILRYGRVIDRQHSTVQPLTEDWVSLETFQIHLGSLKRYCNVVPLDTLIQSLIGGYQIPPNVVALTFDQGWREHYTAVLPLLQQHKMPATFFLSTAYTGTNALFWDRKVELALRHLAAHGTRLSELLFSDPLVFELLSSENSEEPLLDLSRLQLLLDYLNSLPLERRVVFMYEVGTALDTKPGLELPRLFLNWDEVKEISSAGFQLGSCGPSEYPLSLYTSTELPQILEESFNQLRSHDLTPTPVLALPPEIVSLDLSSTLSKIGFRYCLYSSGPEEILPLSEQIRFLPRITVDESNSKSEALFSTLLWRQGSYLGAQFK